MQLNNRMEQSILDEISKRIKDLGNSEILRLKCSIYILKKNVSIRRGLSSTDVPKMSMWTKVIERDLAIYNLVSRELILFPLSDPECFEKAVAYMKDRIGENG